MKLLISCPTMANNELEIARFSFFISFKLGLLLYYYYLDGYIKQTLYINYHINTPIYDNYSWNEEKSKKWVFLSKKCSFCKQIPPFVSKKPQL